MNYITFWMRLTSVPGSASILFSILNTSVRDNSIQKNKKIRKNIGKVKLRYDLLTFVLGLNHGEFASKHFSITLL